MKYSIQRYNVGLQTVVITASYIMYNATFNRAAVIQLAAYAVPSTCHDTSFITYHMYIPRR